MTLKDFTTGQTVYELETEKPYALRERKVKSVGRKYVTLESNWTEKFGVEDYEPNALVEKRDWGSRSLLFPDKNSLELYQEDKKCTKEIRLQLDIIASLPFEQKKQILEWIKNYKQK